MSDVRDETMSEKMARARLVSTDLSKTTDLLNATLGNAETAFIGLRLGVRASVLVTEAQDDNAQWSYLAFEKNDGDWGFFMITGSTSQSEANGSRTSLLRTSKEFRTQAAKLLPALLDALIEVAKRQLATITRLIIDVENLASEMESSK